MKEANFLIYWPFYYRTGNSNALQINYLSGYEAHRYGEVFSALFSTDFFRALPMTKDLALFVLSKLEPDAKKACVIAPYHQVTEWEARRANR